VIAVNLDPSHFFWQSIDPLAVIRALGPKIGHVHGKDTRLNPARLALNGVLDNRWPEPSEEMPWTFATIGRGHDSAWWSAFLQALTEAEFDGTIGIEHEDPFVGPEPGIIESARFLAAHLPLGKSEAAGLAQPPAG
jgi:sugar phosphate isomerase/epimerase